MNQKSSLRKVHQFVSRALTGNNAIRPYYLVPDGKVGHDAYAVIRETIRNMNKVAIGRLVLTSREHIIALEPLKNGLMGTLLRYPYEVRSEDEYFDDIQDVKVTKDMLDLAKHIVEQKSAEFDPSKFDDRYEAALVELVNKKRNGTLTKAKASPRPGTNVVDLMTALQQSLKGGGAPPAAKSKKPAKRASGQKEMLLPISGKREGPGKTGRSGPSPFAKPENQLERRDDP
jgi:DNA end-binding protein Ku